MKLSTLSFLIKISFKGLKMGLENHIFNTISQLTIWVVMNLKIVVICGCWNILINYKNCQLFELIIYFQRLKNGVGNHIFNTISFESLFGL